MVYLANATLTDLAWTERVIQDQRLLSDPDLEHQLKLCFEGNVSHPLFFPAPTPIPIVKMI